MTTLEDIDALLAVEKTLLGRVEWQRDGSRPERSVLVAPLAVGGIGQGGLVLRCHATLHTTPQRGGMILLLHDGKIERMNIAPEHVHLNPIKPSAGRHSGVTLKAGVSRIYPWTLNRTWPRSRSDNLGFGIMASAVGDDFGTAFRWFAARCNVVGELPPPPWQPRML